MEKERVRLLLKEFWTLFVITAMLIKLSEEEQSSLKNSTEGNKCRVLSPHASCHSKIRTLTICNSCLGFW
jgi:hypothetical protein